MKLFIMTRGRVNKRTTIKQLHFEDNHPWDLTLIVPACDYRQWMTVNVNARIEAVSDDWTSGQIRQHITDKWPEGRHIVLDDDLYFFKRGEGTKLVRMNKSDISEMFTWMEHSKYRHGAISAREGNNAYSGEQENRRAMRCMFYDAELLHKHNIRWDAILCRMDFHVSLSLIKEGYPNVINYEFAHNHAEPLGNKGGTTHYRTKAVMDAQAYVLAAMHDPYVVAEPKFTKTRGHRIAVRVLWDKAWKEVGQCKSSNETAAK
jgi:hypothetical protein